LRNNIGISERGGGGGGYKGQGERFVGKEVIWKSGWRKGKREGGWWGGKRSEKEMYR
jgi:hypothetical protein